VKLLPSNPLLLFSLGWKHLEMKKRVSEGIADILPMIKKKSEISPVNFFICHEQIVC
jgi:hypothetical protein